LKEQDLENYMKIYQSTSKENAEKINEIYNNTDWATRDPKTVRQTIENVFPGKFSKAEFDYAEALRGMGKTTDETLNKMSDAYYKFKQAEESVLSNTRRIRIRLSGLVAGDENSPSGTSEKKEQEIIYQKESIGYYEKEIALLKEKQKLLTDPKDIYQNKLEVEIKQDLLDQLTSELKLLESISAVKSKTKPVSELIDEAKSKLGFNESQGLIITPKMQAQIDDSNLRIQAQNAAEEFAKSFNDSLNQSLKSGITDLITQMATDIGTLLSNTDISMNSGKEFGLSILQTVGKFMQTMGGLLIAYAVQMGIFTSALSNPASWPIALAAGVAMVAAGSAISGYAKKGLSKSSATTSSSASGYSNYSTSTGSNLLNGNVTFELQGTKLVGVLNNTNNKTRISR
jgi:hypothetical protein